MADLAVLSWYGGLVLDDLYEAGGVSVVGHLISTYRVGFCTSHHGGPARAAVNHTRMPKAEHVPERHGPKDFKGCKTQFAGAPCRSMSGFTVQSIRQ